MHEIDLQKEDHNDFLLGNSIKKNQHLQMSSVHDKKDELIR